MNAPENLCEQMNAGSPIAPPVLSVDMFDRSYPLMHGGASVVGPERNLGFVLIGIGHPEMDAGLFMGLDAASARAMSAWLLASADELDGGAVTS